MVLRRGLVLAAIVLPTLILPTIPSAHAGSCGVWRWGIKTLSDRRRHDVNFHPRLTHVDKLRHLNAPNSLGENTPRLAPVEDRTYRVKAVAKEATIEDDHDVHLVIGARGHASRTMIVEFPDPKCVKSPFKRHRMGRARHQFFRNCGSISSSRFTQLRGRVVVTGV